MLTTKTYICLQLLHTLLHQLKTRGCSLYCSVLSTISNSKYPDTTLFLFLVFFDLALEYSIRKKNELFELDWDMGLI